MSNKNNRSSFIDELLKDNPREIVESNGKHRDINFCPDCKKGSIVERRRKEDNHLFYACSNFPYCDFTANTLNAVPNVTRQQRHVVSPNRAQTVNRQRRNNTSPNRAYDSEFYPGQIVEHEQFGLGQVKEYLDLGEDSLVVVRFNSGNTKSLMLKYAKLKRVNN